MRPSVFSERSATHTLPAPYARPNGRLANGMRRTTAFVVGLTRTTRPSARSVVQSQPDTGSTMPDCAPTGTFAIGVSDVAAADAQTAATQAATSVTPKARPDLTRTSKPASTRTTLYHKSRTRLHYTPAGSRRSAPGRPPAIR